MNQSLKFIANCAVKALLYEVSASPKPGLVDRFGSGAHTDMDYFTFIDSALALEDTFYQCSEKGFQFKGKDLSTLLERLRPIGIEGENRMLVATGGVNTHKGAIFSLGILCAAAGQGMQQFGTVPDADELCTIASQMSYGLTSDLKETASCKRVIKTEGERLYVEKGVLGVRGEVEAGFPSVRRVGLPVLDKALKVGKLDKNDIMIQILLELMHCVEDTNVLSRYGCKGRSMVMALSEEAIKAGGMYTDKGRRLIEEMDHIFVQKNISPGGTADLLAVTLMLHFVTGSGAL